LSQLIYSKLIIKIPDVWSQKPIIGALSRASPAHDRYAEYSSPRLLYTKNEGINYAT